MKGEKKTDSDLQKVSARCELFSEDCTLVEIPRERRIEQDAREVHYPHNDALVIKINCGSTQLWRVLVDNGSAVDILYYDAFKKMGLNESDMKPAVTSLYRFTSNSIMPRGMIEKTDTEGTSSSNIDLSSRYEIPDSTRSRRGAYKEKHQKRQAKCHVERQSMTSTLEFFFGEVKTRPIEDLEDLPIDMSSK
ncbi:hypothetical protein PanWU01x14_112800, partial [Parasponia andersonii]